MDVVVNGESTEAPVASSQGDYYSNILLGLGYEPESLPLADLLKIYHQLSGSWLIASPVHWEATHNSAMLRATGKALDLSEDESRLWFDQVADFLKADGFTPVYHDAQTWLFRVDDKPKITSQSVHTLLHHPLMPVLRTLDDSLYWQRLITELQMYLSAHPLNTKRQDLVINGLWFWGEGELNRSKVREAISDDELLFEAGLANSRLNSETKFRKDHLVVIKDPQHLADFKLVEKLKKFPVNWYWNNCSYSTKSTRWWSKFWRR